MSFVIIPGRRNGYPCQSQLPETPVSTDLQQPYPTLIFYLSADYPEIITAPDRRSADLVQPYPDTIFRCLGDYPELFSRTRRTVFTQLLSAEKEVSRLFFGRNGVKAAYFGDTEVFRVYYV